MFRLASILFGSQRKLKTVEEFNVVCNCRTIESRTHGKYLSLILIISCPVNLLSVTLFLKLLFALSYCIGTVTVYLHEKENDCAQP